MKLLRLRAHNLFSLGAIDIRLFERGLTLVTGHSYDEGSANGSGKSTLANKAIIWTLFGQTAGGTKGDAVINRHRPDDPCYGAIEFQDTHGVVYSVQRNRNPASLKLYQYGMDQQWTEITCRHQSDTQEMINDLLGRDLTTFLQTDFFGQGRDKSFLALTPAQQVEVLEQILPINDLSAWAANAKEGQKEVKDKIEAVEKFLAYWTGTLDEISVALSMARLKTLDFEVQKGTKVTNLQERIAHYDEVMREKQERLDTLVEELEEAPMAYSTEIATLRERVDKIQEEMEKARADLSKCEQMKAKVRVEYETKKAGIKQVDDNCPTCEQPIPEETKNQLLMEQHELRGQLASLEESVKNVQVGINGWNSHIGRLSLNLTEAKRMYDIRMEHLERRRSLSAAIVAQKEEMDLDSRNKLEAELNQIQESDNPHQEDVSRLVVKEETFMNLMKQGEESLSKLQGELDHLEFWRETFGKNFKTFLFNRACPFLQKRTAHHLTGLGNDQLKVEFDTTKKLKSGDEKSGFSVRVHSESGGDGFDSLSGGEQQMVSFAVGLALADLAETQVKGTSHFLILDEPFMALDDRNCENLVNYLTTVLSSTRETILLISNEENLKALISERIHVEKSGGISSVQK